jgi:hypothetical protein
VISVFTDATLLAGTKTISVLENATLNDIVYTLLYQDPTDNPGVPRTVTLSEVRTSSAGYFSLGVTSKYGIVRHILPDKNLSETTPPLDIHEFGAERTGYIYWRFVPLTSDRIFTKYTLLGPGWGT